MARAGDASCVAPFLLRSFACTWLFEDRSDIAAVAGCGCVEDTKGFGSRHVVVCVWMADTQGGGVEFESGVRTLLEVCAVDFEPGSVVIDEKKHQEI